MYYCWTVFVFNFLILNVATASKTELPPPIHLTSSWKNEFCLVFSWSLPESFPKNCSYFHIESSQGNKTTKVLWFQERVSLERGVTVSVRSDCNNKKSHPVVHTIAAPRELVKDFHCFYYSSNALNCSWLPTNQSPEDIHLYYGYPISNDNMGSISACENYLYSADEKTGCLISGNFTELEVYFQVNGTVNGSSVRNTFMVMPKNNVKPPAPKVTITETEHNLLLSWKHPDLSASRCWEYILNYSKCGELQSLTQKPNEEASYRVTIPYDPRCQYRVQVKAVYSICGIGGSDWSQVEIYGEDEWVITVIFFIIPASLLLFVILFLCCFMKHRKKLFPKIPQPLLTHKGTLDSINKHKTPIGNLYVPVEAAVECKISLRN